MEKVFLTADCLLVDSFKLAEKIYLSGFRPDFIVGIWRGGTPVGIAIQEYLDYRGIPTDHIAIRTSSYTGINQQSENIRVHGLSYLVDNVQSNQSVLLVDDVFDSGRSIQAILECMTKRMGNKMPDNIQVATPWFKPENNLTARIPDFYIHETEKWLVFPHELQGLSLEEIIENKPHIASTLTAGRTVSQK